MTSPFSPIENAPSESITSDSSSVAGTFSGAGAGLGARGTLTLSSMRRGCGSGET